MKKVSSAIFVLGVLAAAAATALVSSADRCVTGSLGTSDHSLVLKLAETGEERREGLMGIDYLPDRAGMLFVFDEEQNLSFWMRNTSIALDLFYLDTSKTVVSMHSMQPQPGASRSELEQYRSGSPAKYAVELEEGSAESLGIKRGDYLRIGTPTRCPF